MSKPKGQGTMFPMMSLRTPIGVGNGLPLKGPRPGTHLPKGTMAPLKLLPGSKNKKK